MPTTIAPPGDGYALVTNHAGLVTLTGALADGTNFSQTVAASAAGDVPVYASLDKNAPAVGSISLTNLEAAPPANLLTWIKNEVRSADGSLSCWVYQCVGPARRALDQPARQRPGHFLSQGESVHHRRQRRH